MEHAHMYCHGWHFFPTVFFILMVVFFIVMYRRRKHFRWWRYSDYMRDPDFCTPSGTYKSAIDLLRKRYAGGEISKEEFDEMQKDLKDLID